jgi:hypothetical protein
MALTSLDTSVAGQLTPAAGWQVDSTRSEMDDSPLVSLRLEAQNEIPTPIEYKRPVLVIRCREHATNLYVLTYSAAQVDYGNYNGATVRLRIDNGKAFTQSWSESTANDALFAPAPVALARQLARADTFRFQFTPFSAATQTVTFPVAGLADKLGRVSSACHWK